MQVFGIIFYIFREFFPHFSSFCLFLQKNLHLILSFLPENILIIGSCSDASNSAYQRITNLHTIGPYWSLHERHF